MINSILIGKTIYNLLNNSEELKKYVGNKIYPLVADNDVSFPFIVYSRTGVTNTICKDGYYEDDVNFSIIVVSNKYIDSLDIANIVRGIFNKQKLDKNIYNVSLDDIDENFTNDAYIQQLYFSCKVNNN